MKFYSDVLKKFYNTVEDLEKDEADYYTKMEAVKHKQAQKDSRKKEVDDAVDKARALIREYINDYGSYSKTGDYMIDLLRSLW